ncbi:hypothetical protein GCM10011519_19170 [Marmoricola endophyticus]|uniref:Uncharacterized protein n=1 Tax=Marmoricola endophyticus TaxID=2040280 RepID=A0A917BKG0_9ACTN|nr:hypothetical protein GCM10011519_19170 [Marmoricola endophyticus]
MTVRAAPKQTVGGSAVTIPLVLTTDGDACTLAVSAKTVVAKITSGSDRIWSSQDCPAAIPATSVTVRPTDEKATAINLAWSGRRSTEGCAGGTAWARAGSYHVVAATYGGQQSDVQFALGVPPRPVVTKTAKPKPTKPVETPKG